MPPMRKKPTWARSGTDKTRWAKEGWLPPGAAGRPSFRARARTKRGVGMVPARPTAWGRALDPIALSLAGLRTVGRREGNSGRLEARLGPSSLKRSESEGVYLWNGDDDVAIRAAQRVAAPGVYRSPSRSQKLLAEGLLRSRPLVAGVSVPRGRQRRLRAARRLQGFPTGMRAPRPL